jgi:hypothetical protein
MPTRTAILLLAAVFNPSLALAADTGTSGSCFLTNDGCTVPGLKTPTSPAFVLIGVSPTQVERPTTPHDVAMTVFDIATTSGGLPRNLALEITPYWLFSHPKLTFEAYTHPSLLDQFLYSASLSVATAPVTGSDTATDLAIGVRTNLFIDRATPEQRRKVEEAKSTLLNRDQRRAAALAYRAANCSPGAGGACPGLTQELLRLGDSGTNDPNKIDPDAILRATESSELVAPIKSLQDALSAREGVVISLSGATSGRTPSGKSLRWGEPTKGAAWIDAGYEIPVFDALAVLRYTHVNQNGALDLFDAGARLIWLAPQFSLSAEYLRRSVLSRPSGSTFSSSDRATATIEFPVAGGIWVSATAGQDAATETRPSTLITLLGISFQASRDRQVTLK